MSIVLAFDTTRIAGDAQSGRARTLTDYLDDLLTPNERFERSVEQMAARLDAKIARDEARKD